MSFFMYFPWYLHKIEKGGVRLYRIKANLCVCAESLKHFTSSLGTGYALDLSYLTS